MAKPSKPLEVETEVTLMRKVAPERFEVVTAVLRGTLSEVKHLERNVSLPVGRMTAQKSLHKQHAAQVAKLGITVES